MSLFYPINSLCSKCTINILKIKIDTEDNTTLSIECTCGNQETLSLHEYLTNYQQSTNKS